MAHGKRLAGRSEAWLGGQGGAGEGDRTTEAERGSSLRFLPPSPSLGFSKPKPAAYLKKKKKKALKESYGQLQKKPPQTHTKSKPFSHLPAHLPPTQEFPVSFLFKLSPVTSPSGGPGQTAGGWGQARGGQSPSLAGGRRERQSPLPPRSRHPPAGLLGPRQERGSRAAGPNGGALSTSGLPTCRPLYLLHLKRTVSSRARHHCHVRDGRCPSRTRKPGQGRRAMETAASPCAPRREPGAALSTPQTLTEAASSSAHTPLPGFTQR